MVENNLPPGFRFHPTDEELITYYLSPRIYQQGFSSTAITEVDLNKCEPWDLPGRANTGEREWYFFSMRDRKYPTGTRTNRATQSGYWKTTGKDKEILGGRELIGMKKTLVFYKGRAPTGEKTNWVMHEYRIEPKNLTPSREDWTVCRVFEKSSPLKSSTATTSHMSAESTSDISTTFDFPVQSVEDAINSINTNETSTHACFPLLLQGDHHLNSLFLREIQLKNDYRSNDSVWPSVLKWSDLLSKMQGQ